MPQLRGRARGITPAVRLLTRPRGPGRPRARANRRAGRRPRTARRAPTGRPPVPSCEGGGAVSRRNCSMAAAIAAASAGEAAVWVTSMRGRRGLFLPLRVIAAREDSVRRRARGPGLRLRVGARRGPARRGDRAGARRLRRHAHGEWRMPSKVYLEAPNGDFRAMPARAAGSRSSSGSRRSRQPGARAAGGAGRRRGLGPTTAEPLAFIDARA